jgi:hypothetical protein
MVDRMFTVTRASFPISFWFADSNRSPCSRGACALSRLTLLGESQKILPRVASHRNRSAERPWARPSAFQAKRRGWLCGDLTDSPD